MNKNHKNKRKAFTLLEILLVIAAIGILAAIVLVAINPNRQIAQARNIVRQADINTIQKALEQYLIEKGKYPIGIDNTYKEICNTGNNSINQGTIGSNCIDLREIVPDYLASIPVNPTTSIQSGYYSWINDVNNKVAVLAGKGENGKVIGINHLKENIVTDGLVLNLDAGNPASYPGTGTTWTDLSGNNNNGTLVNGPNYINNTLQFRVFQSQYATTSLDYGVLKSNNKYGVWSIDVVFKYIDIPPVSEAVIVGRQGCHGGIYINSNSTLQQAIKTNQCWGGHSAVTLGTMNISNWYHTTMVYNNGLTLSYLNGNYVNSGQINFNLYDLFSYSNVLWIGGIDTSGTDYFNNIDIGFVKIYNRALTPEEIQQNFNATRGRFGL